MMACEKTIALVKEVLAAPSCCAELKAAGEKWLASVGTGEQKAAADALLAELKEDVSSIDGVIGFFGSEAGKGYFGAEKAAQLLKAAQDAKAAGGKYCICDACQKGAKLIENPDGLFA